MLPAFTVLALDSSARPVQACTMRLGRDVAYLGNRVNIVPYTLSRTLFIGTGRTGDGPTSLRSLLRTAQAPGLARGSGVPLRGDYGEGIIRINTKEGTTH